MFDLSAPVLGAYLLNTDLLTTAGFPAGPEVFSLFHTLDFDRSSGVALGCSRGGNFFKGCDLHLTEGGGADSLALPEKNFKNDLTVPGVTVLAGDNNDEDED